MARQKAHIITRSKFVWRARICEKMSYCLNCGNECHEGKVLTRTEKTYAVEGAKEYEIEVCKYCRCEDELMDALEE